MTKAQNFHQQEQIIAFQETAKNQKEEIKINAIAENLRNNGYCKIHSAFYIDDTHNNELDIIQKDYFSLPLDIHSNGNRYRKYKKYEWYSKTNSINAVPSEFYFQSKSLNKSDGGKKRYFVDIEDRILNTGIIQNIIRKNFDIVKESEVLNLEQNVFIGIHQIRYLAQNNMPSYSSPIWLHRDDEPVVFSHLFNITPNAVGADFVIAEDPATINQVYFLDQPLETLVVTQKPLHGLTPLGIKDGFSAYRDVLLVTFSNHSYNNLEN